METRKSKSNFKHKNSNAKSIPDPTDDLKAVDFGFCVLKNSRHTHCLVTS